MARCQVQVGVGVCLLRNNDKQVLMIRHIDDGLWRFPGGGRDPGEALIEVASREVLEEVGVDVHPTELSVRHHCFNVFEKYGEWLTFSCYAEVSPSIEPKIMEPDKHDGLDWFSLEGALCEELFPPSRLFIEFILEQKKDDAPHWAWLHI